MTIDKSKVYNELMKLEIIIDFNKIPTPAYIQSLIIECNGYQRKVEKYFIQTTQELSNHDRMLRVEKLNLETKKRHYLINNEKIKKLPTGKEREAAVDELLEDDYNIFLNLENKVASLKDLLSAIKMVQTNLKGTNSDIKTLVRVMEQQISRLNIGSPEDPDIAELSNRLANIDKLDEELNSEMTEEDVSSAEEYIEEDDSKKDEEEVDLDNLSFKDMVKDSEESVNENDTQSNDDAKPSDSDEPGNEVSSDVDDSAESDDLDIGIEAFLMDDVPDEKDSEEDSDDDSLKEETEESVDEPEKGEDVSSELGIDIDISDGDETESPDNENLGIEIDIEDNDDSKQKDSTILSDNQDSIEEAEAVEDKENPEESEKSKEIVESKEPEESKESEESEESEDSGIDIDELLIELNE